MDAHKFSGLIQFVMRAHRAFPKQESNAVRRWDNKTPYYIHPLWCAMTILTEETLPEEMRGLGSQVLLMHDVPEDTTINLYLFVEDRVRQYVSEMIFESSADEMKRIWDKDRLVKLFKLYDKVSNMLDGSWMLKERGDIYYEERINYLEKLTDFVEENFGQLNIVVMARAVAVKCKNQLKERKGRQ